MSRESNSTYRHKQCLRKPCVEATAGTIPVSECGNHFTHEQKIHSLRFWIRERCSSLKITSELSPALVEWIEYPSLNKHNLFDLRSYCLQQMLEFILAWRTEEWVGRIHFTPFQECTTWNPHKHKPGTILRLFNWLLNNCSLNVKPDIWKTRKKGECTHMVHFFLVAKNIWSHPEAMVEFLSSESALWE